MLDHANASLKFG